MTVVVAEVAAVAEVAEVAVVIAAVYRYCMVVLMWMHNVL